LRFTSPSRGCFSSRKVPAPSESIHLKNSLLKAIIGFSSSCFRFSASWLNLSAVIHAENLSEPTQTALFELPDFTDINPYCRAFIPALQSPIDVLTSME